MLLRFFHNYVIIVFQNFIVLFVKKRFCNNKKLIINKLLLLINIKITMNKSILSNIMRIK